MFRLKSQFVFHKQQRVGILSFLAVIIASMIGYYYVEVETSSSFDVSSEEIEELQQQMDSLRMAELEARKPRMYPFNPNFITDYKAYTLGLPNEAYDRLQAFRANDHWINSAKQFQEVTGISDSLQNEISPWFKFPEWVTNPRPKKKYTRFSKEREKSFLEKIDLNIATGPQLQEVYGIGEVLSKRVINYREKLGGFSNDLQLYSVWGLNETVVTRMLKQFTVKEPKAISLMNVNSSSASDLATISGISFDLSKEIWEFCRLREGIDTLEELQKIEGITATKFKLIQLYLSVE